MSKRLHTDCDASFPSSVDSTKVVECDDKVCDAKREKEISLRLWTTIVKDLFKGRINVDGFSCCQTSQSTFVSALETRDSFLPALLKTQSGSARYVVIMNIQGKRSILYGNDSAFMKTLWMSHTDHSSSEDKLSSILELYTFKFDQLDQMLTQNIEHYKQSPGDKKFDGYLVLYLSFPRFASVSNIFWMSKAYLRIATCYPCGKEKHVSLQESCGGITSDDYSSITIDKNWLLLQDVNSNVQSFSQDTELQQYYSNCCDQLVNAHDFIQIDSYGKIGFMSNAETPYDESEHLRKERLVLKALLARLQEQNKTQEDRYKKTTLAFELQIKEMNAQQKQNQSKHESVLKKLNDDIAALRSQVASLNSELLIQTECVNKEVLDRKVVEKELASIRKKQLAANNTHKAQVESLQHQQLQLLQEKDSALGQTNQQLQMHSKAVERLTTESRVLINELCATEKESKNFIEYSVPTTEQATLTDEAVVVHACTQTIECDLFSTSSDTEYSLVTTESLATIEAASDAHPPSPLDLSSKLTVQTQTHSSTTGTRHTDNLERYASPVPHTHFEQDVNSCRVLVVLQRSVESKGTCVLVNTSWIVPIFDVPESSNPWAQVCNISMALQMECPKFKVNPDALRCVGFSQHDDDDDRTYYVYTAQINASPSIVENAAPTSPPASPPLLRPPDFTITAQSNTYLVPISEYYSTLLMWTRKSSSARPFKHILSALDIVQSMTDRPLTPHNNDASARHHDVRDPSQAHWQQYHNLMLTMQTQHIRMLQNMLNQYKIITNHQHVNSSTLNTVDYI